MRKLKLLLIIRDFSKWIHTEPHYLAKELSNSTNLVVWHDPGNIHDIINHIKFVPDFILIYLYGSIESISPPITGLNSLTIPYGIYLEDLHNINNLPQKITNDNVKYIFTCYRDSFYRMYPELVDKVRWLPHHVNTQIFKDYNLPKENNMLMIGAIFQAYYPLRYKILQTLSNNPDFVYHHHPGYRDINDNENKLVKENYAKEINKAKIFFTCDSIYQYPVLKYLEAPACKTLLLASDSRELYDLGFRPGENFIAINEHNFVEKAEYYLRNEKEREIIAENGFKLVHEKHSTLKRTQDLIMMIHEILADRDI